MTEDSSERDARAILKLATGLIAGSAALGLITRLGGGARPDAGTVIGVTVLLACGATVMLMRKNRVRLATLVFITTAWLMVAAITLARGGLYTGTVGLYLMITVIAGVLLSARAAMVTCVASAVATLLLLVVEGRGWLPPTSVTLAYRAVTSVLTLVVGTTIFLIALRRLQRANERLLEVQAELEKTVAERTQSLVVARDQALAAARAKMSFLANMSHELRTPMHAVVGITELLRLRRLDPDTHELVETIGKSGDALVAILDDVLDLAKIEAGRLVVEQAPYSPRALVDELVALLGAFSRRKLQPNEEVETGELNIVPYLDILMNLIIFMLLSMAGLATFGMINVNAPTFDDRGGRVETSAKPSLTLTVAVARSGFFIAATGGVLPGQLEPSSPTIPRNADGSYDYEALRARLMELKTAFPAKSKVIVAAEADTTYEALIATLDATRETADRKRLFPDVTLANF